jgi:hypothetical protein
MRRWYMKTASWLMLAALMVPALASASVDACIAACWGGFMSADAECMMASRESHAVTVSGDCCKKNGASYGSSAVAGQAGPRCDCPTCSLAPSRFFTERASVKVPPIAMATMMAGFFYAPSYLPLVRADDTRTAHIRTGPTRAQLCVYLR